MNEMNTPLTALVTLNNSCQTPMTTHKSFTPTTSCHTYIPNDKKKGDKSTLLQS